MFQNSGRTRVKICGLTRKDDLIAAVNAGVDSIGFIFHFNSPRYIRPAAAQAMLAFLPAFVSVTGVFVNAPEAFVIDTLKQVNLTTLQFHGDETAEYCSHISSITQRSWIKVIRVQNNTNTADLYNTFKIYAKAQAILFDTAVAGYGGAGQSFDWSKIPKNPLLPIILAGGLNCNNVKKAITEIKPYALDVSSSLEFEQQPGIKDRKKIINFLQAVKKADGLAKAAF